MFYIHYVCRRKCTSFLYEASLNIHEIDYYLSIHSTVIFFCWGKGCILCELWRESETAEALYYGWMFPNVTTAFIWPYMYHCLVLLHTSIIANYYVSSEWCNSVLHNTAIYQWLLNFLYTLFSTDLNVTSVI